jgi:hypothetical protein
MFVSPFNQVLIHPLESDEWSAALAGLSKSIILVVPHPLTLEVVSAQSGDLRGRTYPVNRCIAMGVIWQCGPPRPRPRKRLFSQIIKYQGVLH